jgi:hypothetical protein
MALPYFWSGGTHDVALYGDPKYLEHYESLDSSAWRLSFSNRANGVLLSLVCVRSALAVNKWGRGPDDKGWWSDEHIKPVSAYQMTEEAMLCCMNYRNRRPLGVCAAGSQLVLPALRRCQLISVLRP